MNELLIHPAAAFALIGVLMLILVGLYFRHVHLSTRTLVNMSLMLAITVVLHQIKLFHMPQGGSVTAGSMVPLLFIAYRYGARWSLEGTSVCRYGSGFYWPVYLSFYFWRGIFCFIRATGNESHGLFVYG